MSTYPKRYGGGDTTVKAILDSLNASHGSAYDTANTESIVYLKNLAIARAIAAAWGTNERLAKLWDPYATPALARWESILGMPVLRGDTVASRRRRLAGLMMQIGRGAILTTIQAALEDALGDVFVAIEFISLANAVVHVPDATYPWGTLAPGAPWYSTTAHILIRTEVPAGYSDADFFAAVAKVNPIMDAIAPAWVTWDWYVAPAVGAPISVTGGPSAGGWYLDEPNLDRLVFA